MSSNPPSAIATSKAVSSVAQLPSQAQSGPSAASDSHSYRRVGGSGSFGVGAVARASPSPRHNQASKRAHRMARRPGLVGEDAFAEAVAMRSATSRKGQTSITHLMNFGPSHRPHHHHHNHGHTPSHRRNARWGPGSGYHAVDKARYVHANYRFIVDPRGDYHDQAVDADVYLDWNNVLQVLISARSQFTSCPICLEKPVAPRMAKCGHVFCLSCLVRFMHSDSESKPPEKKPKSKRCPICEDNIYLSDARPARFYTGQECEPPREGADVVLRLVMRSSGRMLALPRDGADALPKSEDIPWYVAAEVMDYARIMKGSETYMTEQFEAEIQEIERQAKEDELMFGEDNTEWSRKALRLIRESKDTVKAIGNPPTSSTTPPESKLNKCASATNPAGHLALPDQTGGPGSANISNLSKSLLEFRTRHPDGQAPPEYYFYHALLHHYLSPLDIRILKAAFGAFASFPATVLPRVERVSTGHVVDDDLRKRTKYLAHLPSGCEVSFLECDWRDVVAPEILEKFSPEIQRRRTRHRDKEIREEKARARAEKEEDQKAYAHTRRKRNSMSSAGLAADDFQPLVPTNVFVSADGDGVSSSPLCRQRQGFVFASLASPSTSPIAPKTVWGTTAFPASSSPPLPASDPEHEPDDAWLQGWEKDLVDGIDLVAQAQAGSPADGGSPGGSGNTMTTKKKKKKITLMSTNVRRGA